MKNPYILSATLFVLVLGVTGCAGHKGAVCTMPCVKKECPFKTVIAKQAKHEPVQAPSVQPASVVVPVAPVSVPGGGYHFGDYRSETLTAKAWQALAEKNTDAVLVYTKKCVELYSAQAAKMQSDLKGFPSGDLQKVFSYWALNDVATCLFIQGESYRKAGQMDHARAAYQRIRNEFSYGQAYDPANKSFWKIINGTKDALYMIDKGLDLNYGNMSSQFLVQQMWGSLARKSLEEAVAYGMKLESLYGQKAKEMQASLKEYPSLPAENVNMSWALNDVGTGMFILGEAYSLGGQKEEALKAYRKVISDYSYAQCWDPQGWFWKPVDAAQQKIMEVEAVK